MHKRVRLYVVYIVQDSLCNIYLGHTVIMKLPVRSNSVRVRWHWDAAVFTCISAVACIATSICKQRCVGKRQLLRLCSCLGGVCIAMFLVCK